MVYRDQGKWGNLRKICGLFRLHGRYKEKTIKFWLGLAVLTVSPPALLPPGESPMLRTFTVTAIACLTFGLVGCRFCASPYDYCSPTFTGNNYEFYHGNPCNPNYAAGSRFLGTEGVCRSSGCSTCEGYSTSGCSDCETKHYDFTPETEKIGVPTTRATTSNVKSLPASVKKMPSPSASQVVAVPQTIQGAPTLKNVQVQPSPRELPAAPRPAVPQPNYARQAIQELTNADFSDPNKMLNELKADNPDAFEVKIIGFE